MSTSARNADLDVVTRGAAAAAADAAVKEENALGAGQLKEQTAAAHVEAAAITTAGQMESNEETKDALAIEKRKGALLYRAINARLAAPSPSRCRRAGAEVATNIKLATQKRDDTAKKTGEALTKVRLLLRLSLGLRLEWSGELDSHIIMRDGASTIAALLSRGSRPPAAATGLFWGANIDTVSDCEESARYRGRRMLVTAPFTRFIVFVEGRRRCSTPAGRAVHDRRSPVIATRLWRLFVYLAVDLNSDFRLLTYPVPVHERRANIDTVSRDQFLP
ncbi:hypothetical protein C8R45DRAFT_927534 [Mycena sanguinolenta]|nr:hypothetical protein C8R45DRAFT_927534 [Mycena sanguinolenta]